MEAGLLIAADDIPVPYDRFRDRVMFPITDLRGRVVAFGGRALEKDVSAKYLNSPETSLFHKGSLLYNGFNARAAAHKGAPVIAAEGYVDVIALVEAGFSGAVAPLGTALTEDQLALLWKMAQEPVLLFDGDKAGRRAAYRALDLALPHLKPGVSLSFGMLPGRPGPGRSGACRRARGGGRRAGAGAPARRCAVGARDREWQLRHARAPRRAGGAGGRDRRPDRRRDGAQALPRRADGPLPPHVCPRGHVEWRPAPVQAGEGRRRFNEPREAVRGAGETMRHSAVVRGASAGLPRNEALLLFAVLNHSWLLDVHAEELAELPFLNREAAELRRVLLDAHMEGESEDEERLAARLKARNLDGALTRVRACAVARHDWPAFADAGRGDVELWWHQRTALHRRAHALSKELREAEKALADDPTEMNWARFLDVQKRLAALDGTEALVEGFGAASGRPARSM